jgi:uncharacterized protein (TIGR02300 family)
MLALLHGAEESSAFDSRAGLCQLARFRHLFGRTTGSPVANEDLGTKRDCPNCGARFYDLNNDPAHCPKCAHEFTPDVLLKSRKRTRDDDTVAKPSKEVDDNEGLEDENEVAEVDENATSLEDADDEATPVKSKRVKAMDEDTDEDDDDEEEDDDLADLEDIDLPDDDDDDTLLDDEDEDDGLGGIPTGAGDDEER